MLVTSEGALGDSSDILAYADERLPVERRLHPADAEARAQVVGLRSASTRSSGRRDGAGCTSRSSRNGRRSLVGERFSAADLAFAALAAPAISPLQHGTPVPQPEDMPDGMAAAVRRWREHPAGQYGLRLFREER